MSGIRIQDVSRRFGSHVALDGVDLTIEQGEFFSLLGPSGCGKTTLLNIVAGFLDPSAGAVFIGDRDVTALPPYRRDIGMVFQNYALFPHLSVFDNVAYGLRVRKMAKEVIQQKVEAALDRVHLSGYAERMPIQLSGGQQQRVAIARALAVEPQVLLLDEPLSNLDAKLRKEMQTELRRIQRSVGITTVLVTHDQEEALSLSDRIGILGAGKLQQIGSPQMLYRRPANRFVAEFIGQANLLPARADGEDYLAIDKHASGAQPLRLRTTDTPAGEVLLMLRPERIHVTSDDEPPAHTAVRTQANTIAGVVTDASYIGAAVRLTVAADSGGVLYAEATDSAFPRLPEAGLRVSLRWTADDLVALPVDQTAAP